MKWMTRTTALLAIGSALLLTGCRDSTDCGDCYDPDAPHGVYTVTGDGLVEIFWDEVDDGGLEGYRVYRSMNPEGPYHRIGSSADTYHVDDEVVNGNTYYYAVTAYDHWGYESELSHALIYDTPRPSGTGLVLEDEDATAGIDFSGYYDAMVVPWDDVAADAFLFWDGVGYAMASTDVLVGEYVYGTDLQHWGPVDHLDEIDYAPEGGWTTAVADTVSLIEGHAYLVWTWENHFAKFRVRAIGYDYVVLDWAYQNDEGNPELVVLAGGDEGAPRYAGHRARADRPENAEAWSQRTRAQRNTAGSR